MKTLRSSRPRGGILVFALMCSGVAVLGLTFWVTTIATRGKYVDTLQDGAARRVAKANSSALAARFMEMKVLPGGSGTSFALGFGDGATWDWDCWGGIQLVAGWWDPDPKDSWPKLKFNDGNDWEGYSVASRIITIGTNRISMGDTEGFGLDGNAVNVDGTLTKKGYDLPLQLLDGYGSTNFRWQARSYPAPLAGDLLSVHRSGIPGRVVNVSGVIEVQGRAHMHFRSGEGDKISIGNNVMFGSYGSNGYTIPGRTISNYPPVYSESWTTGGAADSGRLGVVWKDSGTGYSLKNKVLDGRTFPENYEIDGQVASTNINGYSSDGSGTVTIDLGQPTLDGVVVKNVQTLVLTGQTTETQLSDVTAFGAVLVVVRNDTGKPPLSKVLFHNENNRRLVLAVRSEDASGGTVSFDFPNASILAGSAPRWRMMLVAERTPIAFNPAGGSLDITGGIITDDSLTAPASPGRVRIVRDYNPVGLATKAPRRAWVEGYRAD